MVLKHDKTTRVGKAALQVESEVSLALDQMSMISMKSTMTAQGGLPKIVFDENVAYRKIVE